LKTLQANDERNLAIKNRLEEAFNSISGPRVGDFVRMLDGTLRRFTHDHENTIQVTPSGAGGYESFHLTKSGRVSYSGGLDTGISYKHLKETAEFREGIFWFFDSDLPGKDRGIEFSIECRVYREF